MMLLVHHTYTPIVRVRGLHPPRPRRPQEVRPSHATHQTHGFLPDIGELRWHHANDCPQVTHDSHVRGAAVMGPSWDTVRISHKVLSQIDPELQVRLQRVEADDSRSHWLSGPNCLSLLLYVKLLLMLF